MTTAKFLSMFSFVPKYPSAKFEKILWPNERDMLHSLLHFYEMIRHDVMDSIVLCYFCHWCVKSKFSGFFWKILGKQTLKLNISRTAWPISVIHISFFRILKALSYKINLSELCSWPLRQFHGRGVPRIKDVLLAKIFKVIREIIYISCRNKDVEHFYF